MLDIIFQRLNKHRNKVIIVLATLTVLDFLTFWQIFSSESLEKDLKLYFLDIGQGDSELVILPGGVKMLIDGGPPNGKVLENLANILSPLDRYIDLVMISHPQLDHFGGLIDVLKRYKIGAVLTNGREGTTRAFQDLEKVIEEHKIKTIILASQDKIHYQGSSFNMLSPTPELLKSKEINETSLVLELESNNSKTLFTGDIGKSTEEGLLKSYNADIDILKVAHHGSKFSSTADFLNAMRPEVAVIGVGKNSYGHPTKEALSRLSDSGAKIFRTDQDGTVKLVIDGKSIKIFKISK
jgi:beta-lactamase superfamily II metal-dependent hydrolase